MAERDEELAALQDDVTQLTGRINEMNIEQNEKIGSHSVVDFVSQMFEILHFEYLSNHKEAQKFEIQLHFVKL